MTSEIQSTTPAEDEAFRQELVAFLESNPPGRPERVEGGRMAWKRRWAVLLADSGYAMPSWPKRWGGMDLPLAQQLVYHEEMARAQAPPHPNVRIGIVGPTIIKYGTEAQRERFLGPMVRGDEIWAQGFSEPEAGSDLPSLRTRATRQGDDYVVTGQKLWTSAASKAAWMFALVRTGEPDSGRAGISYLLVDLTSPGIAVREIRDLTGVFSDEPLCEVFLDAVRVPVANRVGEENEGWRIARTSLGHERSTNFVARAVNYRRIMDDLIELAHQRALDDDHLWDELGRLEIMVRLIRLNGMRTVSEVLRHGEPGPASSADRLFYALFEQRLHEVAVDVCGPFGMLGSAERRALDRGRWVYGFLRTRASTIGAGTAQIQRNTLAERVLGLPPDAARAPSATPEP